MSWAAHNPEAYDEILKAGIAEKISKELAENGFDFEDDCDFLLAIVESLSQAKDTKVYDELVKWSQHEIADAEADYWASIADSAAP